MKQSKWRKPSDTPERRLERVRRHRAPVIFKPIDDERSVILVRRRVGDEYAALPRAILDYMIATDEPHPGRATEAFAVCIEVWGLATRDWLRALPRSTLLAIEAMLAERRDPSGHPTQFGGDAPRYRFEWRISDSDVALRMQRQFEIEGTGGFEDQVELWALARRANRNTRRKRLKLRGGSHKEFDIAEAYGPAVRVEITDALQLLYCHAILLEGGRDYTFVWTPRGSEWPTVRWPGHLCFSKYHWDARPLHFGEISEREPNVNRAIFKAPIPGAVADWVAFRPTWWAEQGRNNEFPGVWRPALLPVIIGEAHPRDWQFDQETEVKSLVRRKAPWVRIGLSWVSPKRLAREDQRGRAWKGLRWARLPLVIRELQEIASSQGRVYTPPPRKTLICLAGRHKERPVDHWQDRAERMGWVVVAADERDQRRIVHKVDKPPIPATLPVLAKLSKLTGKSEAELARMDYTYPPIITAFEREHTRRLANLRESAKYGYFDPACV